MSVYGNNYEKCAMSPFYTSLIWNWYPDLKVTFHFNKAFKERKHTYDPKLWMQLQRKQIQTNKGSLYFFLFKVSKGWNNNFN